MRRPAPIDQQERTSASAVAPMSPISSPMAAKMKSFLHLGDLASGWP